MTPLPTKVEFKFGHESAVSIKANGRSGTVTGMMQDRDKTNWMLVEYADNAGALHEQWMRESGLS